MSTSIAPTVTTVTPASPIVATSHVTISMEDFIASIKASVTTVEKDTESFFSSPIFLDHIRTWVFVLLAIGLGVFLYVHESNSVAASNAQAAEVIKEGTATQAGIDKQISAIHEDTKTQVAAIQQQIQQVQTVAQTIAAIKANVPPVTINPIVTIPATASAPQQTSATEQAKGSLPVATISGDDLKTLADQTFTCKAQSVELNSCKQTYDLDQQKITSLTTENTALQKIKVQPAWKKTLMIIGQVFLGFVVGKAL